VRQNLAYAWGPPPGTALLRDRPEDFQVVEELPFRPSDKGDHVWLLLRKRNTNTLWLARQLARIAGVRLMDVGYAGLKDRRALTTQWFSVNLTGRKEPIWEAELESVAVQVLEAIRHPRKLRRGILKANCFQRFGREGQNLGQVQQWFAAGKPPRERYLRSLLLSSARAFLFNKVLAERVRAGHWNRPLSGEVLMRTGRRGFFLAAEMDEVLKERICCLDCHPSGPLWGRGELPTRGEVRILEEQVLMDCELWRKGLEQQGLKQERRSLRLVVANLEWSFPRRDVLQLHFRLPAGTYATAVLREIVESREPLA
jgi:tRNA pseudouridine13 synthase